jgi:AcrR family transcriptional regulator
MRARLIDAAIDCLNRLGYSATTLATIAEAAGVSRGGMLHQFPTKVDLMLAVVAFASGHDERAEALSRFRQAPICASTSSTAPTGSGPSRPTRP